MDYRDRDPGHPGDSIDGPWETELTKEEKTMAMLCHATSLCAFVGVPFGHIVAPLVLWLLKKDESEYIDFHGRESLNFQISVTIYGLICVVLVFVFIGFFLLVALLIFQLVVVIMASVRANDGVYYRYPLSIRFL